MIKFIITAILCSCINIAAVSQQHGKAYYAVQTTSSFNKSADSIDKLYPQNPLKNVDKSVSELSFVLSFNNNLAVFKEDNSLIAGNESSFSKNMAKIVISYFGSTFYDFKNNNVILEKDSGGSIFLINRPLDYYQWTLTKETLIINNLKCYKATTIETLRTSSGIVKEPVTAWYTTDINVPIGPAGYSGLPGLIIQIERDKYVYTLKKIEFTDQNINITLPTKGKKMTQKEYDLFMEEMVNNRSNNYKD
jgi:GLPGLI family protein